MITSAQIRAARAMLDWSRSDLAVNSGVGLSALMRIEVGNAVPRGQVKTLESVQLAFETAGIEFIGSPENGAGVRWREKK